ncbi:hypothetical protein E2C01_015428 [Portunus trituberculatus]|uniref:Uncharacterized protein n=1 Tax=Portunus trituberculatus TaxID=210409 RepID=A0A5B7DN07_PORTR|nr:hypothetical protein [Portunus trituberculatus]
MAHDDRDFPGDNNPQSPTDKRSEARRVSWPRCERMGAGGRGWLGGWGWAGETLGRGEVS